MPQNTLDIKTVCQCNQCLGMHTLHPQVSLINLESPEVEQEAVKFEFYAILLIEESEEENHCCGRKYYDYSNASMVFLTPGEIFRMSESNALPSRGWLLAFHPDLLYHTSLNNHIENYTFFRYNKEEALHLSKRETATVTCCIENIEEELHHDIDSHTGTILSRHIELLLDYCGRFYERQFITRENKNKELMKAFRTAVHSLLINGQMKHIFPTASSYFSHKLHLSEAYFTDLLQFETGQSMDNYLQLARIEVAKQLLATTSKSPTCISSSLGFSNVQRFSKLFKALTGTTPHEYRNTVN